MDNTLSFEERTLLGLDRPLTADDREAIMAFQGVGIVWGQDTETCGTSLRGYYDVPLDRLVTLSGLNPYDPDNYRAPEDGYEGWELHGTFNGEAFNLYTRWGVLRIGGTDRLDVLGFRLALDTALGITGAFTR